MNQRERRIWVFDFDGTISHLVPVRDAAAIDPSCEDLLRDLACDSSQLVAVVSSRMLADLKPRITVANVLLSGSSGLEWWVPGGHWIGPTQDTAERLKRERADVLPALAKVGAMAGVEIEDKTWSVAIHYRNVIPDDRMAVARELENLRVNHSLTLHYGPDVAELNFLREVSKKSAVRTLLKLLGPKYRSSEIVYSGDDQNDAQAMRWVAERKGIVFVVGNRLNIEVGTVVDHPAALAIAIRERFRIPVRHRFGLRANDDAEVGA